MKGVLLTIVIVAGLGSITALEIWRPEFDRGLVTQIVGIVVLAVPALIAALNSKAAAATSEANATELRRNTAMTEATARSAGVNVEDVNTASAVAEVKRTVTGEGGP